MKKIFDASSPGFLYTLIVAILGIFATFGVQFTQPVTDLGQTITTSLSTGGIYAVIGVIIASVIFPIWNRFKYGGHFMASTLTWISLANIALSLLALIGFHIPEGSVEKAVGFIQAKDWFGLIGMIVVTVGPAIIRLIKAKSNPPVVGAYAGGGPTSKAWES